MILKRYIPYDIFFCMNASTSGRWIIVKGYYYHNCDINTLG